MASDPRLKGCPFGGSSIGGRRSRPGDFACSVWALLIFPVMLNVSIALPERNQSCILSFLIAIHSSGEHDDKGSRAGRCEPRREQQHKEGSKLVGGSKLDGRCLELVTMALSLWAAGIFLPPLLIQREKGMDLFSMIYCSLISDTNNQHRNWSL